MAELYRKLREYCGSDYYPFHMPGHKRRLGGMADPLSFDITEIEGFDNLHHAEGILLEAQQRAARLYGAEETHFLVNGSTAGILCALGACAPSGKILMARNSHKAAYHGVYLNRLEAVYLYPGRFISGKAGFGGGQLSSRRLFGGLWEELNGPILADEVEAALERETDIRAVFITSPTYDGVNSDVAAIAQAAHRRGIPLIVDAAHGAHFGMHPMFPENAVRQGADVVIHSLHKTLPAPTQTALLHVNGPLVDRRRLGKLLQIYQTSSPSYVLMAGIDECVGILEERGQTLFDEFARKLEWLREEMKSLRVLDFARSDDPSKLLIGAGKSGLTGLELSGWLRETYHLELEMAAGSYALALTSVGDDWEGFRRLAAALLEMDETLAARKEADGWKISAARGETDAWKGSAARGEADSWKVSAARGEAGGRERGSCPFYIKSIKNETVMTIARAEESLQEKIPLAKSGGRVCGEYIYRYPPGVPLAVPGERISRELLAEIREEKRLGYQLQGTEDYTLETVWAVQESVGE